MFTGIVEEIGSVHAVLPGSQSLQLVISATTVLEDVKLGDSIAVNGVCLTVTHFTATQFHADVMPETFRATSLRTLKRGAQVNLERAMAANGRFGGHFVAGHVDAVGEIIEKRRVDNALYMTISVPSSLQLYMLPKGSVALDGTSLTLFDVQPTQIKVSLIPHTQAVTVLAAKAVGEVVNMECDLLAKYVGRMVQQQKSSESSVTVDFLDEHGFL